MILDLTWAAASAGIGYLFGSLPFGYLVAKAHGVDIFKVGSCSPGATNVKRSVGKNAGNLVFALDSVKGVVASGLPAWLSPDVEYAHAYGLIGLASAVAGHSYSVFTRFRGGKGVATMLGGVAALMPWAALVGVAIWLAVFYATRYVSAASIVMALSLPVTNFTMGQPASIAWVSAALAALVVIRHKANISRLMRGEELRFERKPAKGGSQ